jgi:peptide/nickel transport system substrate-binding protein
MLIRMVFLMICSMCLLALAACSSVSEPTPNETAGKSPAKSTGGKAVYIGITNPVATLNPINAKDTSSIKATSLLFDSLFDLDESLTFLPKLAESFETNDNQNYIIKLNPKAKWTDGQPLTADDVLFTLTVMANPKTISLGLQPLSIIDGLDENGRLPQGKTDISGVKIVDPHTLKITTKSPVDPNFLKEKLGVEILFLPKHILKDVEPEKLHQHPFMQKPNVTSGSFKVVEYSKDQFIEFEANKDYYRGWINYFSKSCRRPIW